MQPKVGHSFILIMRSSCSTSEKISATKACAKETASHRTPANAEYAKCIVTAFK